MSTRLDENLGAVGFDNLINSSNPPADVFGVDLIAGQGVLKRGTLLAKATGGMVMIAAANTGKANCILSDDADTGEDDEAPVVTGVAYRTGHFNGNALIVADGYTITADDKEALRVAGILLSDAVEI